MSVADGLRSCTGIGQFAVLRDGKWVCPDCGVEIVPEARGHLSPAQYAAYLNSPSWARRRDRAITGAGGRCRGCNTEEHLEVHHRTYERLGIEEPEDLTVLCAPCHTAVHLVADARRGVVRSTSRKAWS